MLLGLLCLYIADPLAERGLPAPPGAALGGACTYQGCEGLHQHQPGGTGLRVTGLQLPAACFVEGLQELSARRLQLCCLPFRGCGLC